MTQSDKFKKFRVGRDKKTQADNIMTKFVVYYNDKPIFKFNKFKIFTDIKTPWWEIGKNDINAEQLEISIEDFIRIANSPKENVFIQDTKEVGNMLIFEFNESNYLLVTSNNDILKLELVNFEALYPMVNDIKVIDIIEPK